MKSLRSCRVSFTVFVFTLVALWGAVALGLLRAQMPTATPFQDGDRICFVGDSITHGGSYHTQVLLFYLTRFPERKLQAWNCGISGDSAAGTLKRFDWDIAPHKPTVSTMMLGMNDVNRGLYATDKSGEAVEAQRKEAIAKNGANMDALAGRLQALGSRLLFITPSLFDQTGDQTNDKLTGVNDALKVCAAADRLLAEKYQAGVIDFNGPMERLNAQEQAKDPHFTLIGKDRVHPGPVGHLVMAYLFLKAQGMTPVVSTVGIDAATGAVTAQENATVSQLQAKEGAVTFELLEKSLPFPVVTAAEPALALVPWTSELNQELLKVAGLKPGAYELHIDGASVLKATAQDLAAGVNLALVKETPQYKQALAVQELLSKRAGIENDKLRTFAQVNAWLLAPLKERSPEAEQKAVVDKLQELRNSTGQYNNYYINVLEKYQKFVGEKDSFARQVDELLQQAYAANTPKPHRYELRAVATP